MIPCYVTEGKTVAVGRLPSLHVAPELREAAENVLLKGESLSSFVETSIRENIARRQIQAEFLDPRPCLARPCARNRALRQRR